MPVVELSGGQFVPLECVEVSLSTDLLFLRESRIDLNVLLFLASRRSWYPSYSTLLEPSFEHDQHRREGSR